MKRHLILCLIICVALLSGCNSAKPGVNGPTPNQVTYLGENHKTQTLKIIDGAEGGNLILAGTDNSNVYTLDVTKVEVMIDGNKAELKDLEDGMPIDIFYDGELQNVSQKHMTNSAWNLLLMN